MIKILTLSTIIVLAFNIGDNLINANQNTDNIAINETKTSNISKFKKITNNSIAKTGVAIATNMGIRHTQKTENKATIYRDIFSVSEIMSNGKIANDELIGANMLAISEYRNVLKTNIKILLDSTSDRSSILNAFIEQLEFRYIVGAQNEKKLKEQKSIFISNMKTVGEKIKNLKIKIDSDFRNNDAKASLENIDTYLELKKQYYYSRTYTIYINHFLKEYASLNNYNKLLLDTLINNKNALIKNAYVVIPDSGSGLLKKFDLIYSEQEYKK